VSPLTQKVSLILGLSLLVFAPPAFAAISISVSNVPASADQNQEFSATVTLDCSQCGTSYLRGVFFYPESSTSYFGYTQNVAGAWVSATTDKTQFYKVQEGSFSGELKFKFDSQKPPGPYFFKVGRYTASGDSFSQKSDPVSILVTGPTSTPEPTNTPKPQPTQNPTHTPVPTHTSSLFEVPPKRDEVGPTPEAVLIANPVLGVSTIQPDSPSPTLPFVALSQPKGEVGPKLPLASLAFISLGLFVLALSGFLIFRVQN
jgi:hypothetical protein